jgi:hypothetical protein
LEVASLAGRSSLPLEDFISMVITQIFVDSQTITLGVESSDIKHFTNISGCGQGGKGLGKGGAECHHKILHDNIHVEVV